jgi:uncharacterized protein (TIGR03435 family)
MDSVREAPRGRRNPSILTALEEQLGLTLVLTRGPADTVVVEHVERLTEN